MFSRYRNVLIVSAGFVLLAAAGLAFWLARSETISPETPGAQSAQVGDLRVTFQIDQPQLGTRVADISIDGAAASPAIRAAHDTSQTKPAQKSASCD